MLENLKAVLAADGLTMDNIVSTTVFLKDLNEFVKMNEIYGTFFKEKPPARATIGVARLPRDVKIQISGNRFSAIGRLIKTARYDFRKTPSWGLSVGAAYRSVCSEEEPPTSDTYASGQKELLRHIPCSGGACGGGDVARHHGSGD